jgi:ferrous iron transport protein B
VAKESGSAWSSLFLIVYTTGLAWLMSFAVYQVGGLIIN